MGASEHNFPPLDLSPGDEQLLHPAPPANFVLFNVEAFKSNPEMFAPVMKEPSSSLPITFMFGLLNK